MNPTLVTSVLAGFMVGVVIALILVRLTPPRRSGLAARANDAAAWAGVLSQALRELKTRQAVADSQREDAESRAVQAELLYRVILDSVPNGVVTFDGAGALVTVNPVARRLLGTGAAGTDLPFPLATQLQTALSGGTPPYLETDLMVGSAAIPVGVQTRPLAVGGSTAGAVMVLVELAELRRLQTRARLVEELADLGQLTAGIAHEFRNASGTLRAAAQFLAGKVEGPAREAVDDLLQETDRLARVTTDLLDFARPWERGIESVELDAVVQEVAQHLQAAFPAYRAELTLSCPGRTVLGKGTLLARVVDNLVRNAIEAGPQGGSVLLRTSEIADESGRWLTLQVMDRGAGLTVQDEEEAFFPFRSTKAGGTGMGLTLARKIARLHGGTVTLANRDGGGAVATLKLPPGEAVA
ncbi:MAG: ATP-binding protein [Candidatus Eisenbacteria bacterium]|nr:ATP-binding protein [Candidatus Eisenbacteria bacterium]